MITNLCMMGGKKTITKTRKHENTKYFKIFFVLSCFVIKNLFLFPDKLGFTLYSNRFIRAGNVNDKPNQ